MRSFLVLVLAVFLFTLPSAFAKKKEKEQPTQTLAVTPDPPPAVSAQTRRLEFHTSSLLSHGLLSAQTHEAVREILKATNGSPIVKIRAFVAGTGDMRRVSQIVSETFAEKKHMALPAVSVVQVGGLPLESAQVVLEAISENKRDVNPNGLLYLAPQPYSSHEPLDPLAPLADQSLAALAGKLAGRGQALRVTCFVSGPQDSARIAASMASRFPGAALDLVQTQRAAATGSAACEAIARANSDSLGANPALPPDPSVAALNSDRVVLTGAQLAFGLSENDGRLAFRRLDRVLASFGTSLKSAVALHVYPLSSSIASQANRLRLEFINPAHPPVTTTLHFESLPGMDASFALEAIAPLGAASTAANVLHQ